MADYPEVGSYNWAEPLKEYIDEDEGTALQDHIDNPTNAHMASAIGFVPTGPITADNVQGAIVQAAAGGSAALPYFLPEAYGAIGDGVTDDTAAFQACIAAALPTSGTLLLSAKDYAISDLLQFVGAGETVSMIGMGQSASVIKAIDPAAGLAWGEGAFGPGWTGQTVFGRPSVMSGWKFDGNQIATQGVTTGCTVGYMHWSSVWVDGVDGDGWSILGSQNSVFSICNSAGNSGHGWVIDYGTGNVDWIACQSASNDGYNWDIRQSGGLGWGTNTNPTFLNFINCQGEDPGSPYFADTGLGGMHITDGTYITLDRCTFSESVASGVTVQGSLVLSPTAWSGTGGATAWVSVRDSYLNTVYIDAESGGAAGSMGGNNEPLYLYGLNTILTLKNGSTGYVRDMSNGAGALTYSTEGTGAAAYIRHGRKAKTTNDPIWQGFNSAGTQLVEISSDGTVWARYGTAQQTVIGNISGFGGFSIGNDAVLIRSGAGEFFSSKTIFKPATAAGVPVVARQQTSQTADLIQAQLSGGTPIWAIDKDGIPQWIAAGNQQTTVGAAGGASAPPATPAKWLKVKDSTGTVYVIPAYTA